KSGDIASFVVRGARKGSDEEIFLLSAIFQLATKTRWGTETDLVTAIGWPPKGGGRAPQGRVTVRIDANGAAAAQLIGVGPVPVPSHTTVAAGSTRLVNDFGFASVTGWPGKDPAKDDAEVSDVVAAMELLKKRAPQDVAALKGVDLIRVASLG